MFGLVKRYGFIGLLRLSFFTALSRAVYGKSVRTIKCFPVVLNRRNIVFGEGFTAGAGLRVEAVGDCPGQVLFGKRVIMNDYVHIGAARKVVINDDVLIGSRVTIVDHDHGCYSSNGENRASKISEPPNERVLHGDEIHIGKNVWIGDGAVILSGVTLGESVVVGANAVVTKSFPAGVIIGGVPARQIGKIG